MSTIGNIYLIWRQGRGERRIPIGVLKQSATEGVRFSYLSKGVEEAKKNGFQFYTGFPDVNKEYAENVLEIFGQRIVKSERNDLSDFYDFWKVDTSKTGYLYYMLAQTQGLLPTDNFEFLADFHPISGTSFISEISGLSHKQIPSNSLKVGDVLSFERESSNEHDKYAVLLFKDDLELGYIKKYHSKVVFDTKYTPTIKVHHIEKNGVLKRVFIAIEF